jgi:hypothetical protein
MTKDVYLREGEREFRKLDVSFQFAQVYSSVMKVVSKVTSTSSLHLLFWIISKMNNDNIVVLRKNEKLDFIFDCQQNGGNKYSLSTVSKSIRILVDADILISHNLKNERLGAYIVNPMYFWKGGNQDDRSETIVNTLEFKKFIEDENNRI